MIRGLIVEAIHLGIDLAVESHDLIIQILIL